jgi:hypothetical protein
VLAAELSGDDKLDLVVALAGQKNVAVLAGQAGGMLGNATTVAAGVEPRWLIPTVAEVKKSFPSAGSASRPLTG